MKRILFALILTPILSFCQTSKQDSVWLPFKNMIGIPKDEIAFKFHAYLADVISEVMHKYKFHQVALSGGVFQNALLLELIAKKLQPDSRIFIHHELSPNDENIAVGQLTCVALGNKKENLSLLHTVNLN